MRKEIFLLISIFLIILLAGCVKSEKPTEFKFKNDVVTIEKITVDNLSPYEGMETSIQFEVRNNGDKKIPYLEVDFFDLPGFEVLHDKEGTAPGGEPYKYGGLKCDPVGVPVENKCVFSVNNALEPLDVRYVTLRLKPKEKVTSPTPYTISFAVRYVYFGSREAHIPIIDDLTKKQPLTKFKQTEPSIGPVVLDIDPLLEREVIVGDKTVKQYWGIGGSKQLPFSVKFKFKHVGTVGKIKEVNISEENVRLNISGLKNEACSNFNLVDINNKPKFNVKLPEDSSQYNFDIEELGQYNLISAKPVLVPFDTLLCTFKPTLNQPEYTGIISALFAYKYEFIKTQQFVVQPLPG